ncbi:MAG: NAD(P)/FAD-dependent oxidoreductase [Actinomycetota bacterium]
MKNFDWIIIGAGITGAALSYELAKTGFSVLLLEQDATFQNATRYSYGGLAFWSGTTDLTRELCQEGIERHRNLSEELEGDTQFRELDLLLTIPAEDDPELIVGNYKNFATVPRFLSVETACELEPLLNPHAIAGVLAVRHGHISPEGTAAAYRQAFLRRGGKIEIAQVTGFLRAEQRVVGIQAGVESYQAANVVVCAGGLSRRLLQAAGIPVRVYFTHAEMVEVAAAELEGVQMRTLVMSASLPRFQLEAVASQVEVDPLWDERDREIVPAILDAGAIQFRDGSLRMGQISRALSNPEAAIDPQSSEAIIRTGVGKFLPALETVPGTWHHCLVAFSSDGLPLIGSLPNLEGLHLFSGFSNPLVFIPPLAQRFAKVVAGQKDERILQLSPARFS